jgi:hypothetical protein
MSVPLRRIATYFKHCLRFFILGSVLFFLMATVRENWQQVIAIRFNHWGWLKLAIATIVTLLAHVWSGWVWGWILAQLNHPVKSGWAIRVYLKTNIAKYLPGNMWHFYGRINAARQQQIPLDCATLSVLLETLLMMAAGLGIALAYPGGNWQSKLIFLGAIAVGVHPRSLNLALRLFNRLKLKETPTARSPALTVKHYPLKPTLGELMFLGLRGTGFLWVMLALTPIDLTQVLLIFSAFSWAWLFGIIIPGAPGGIGIFESTAIALLADPFTPGIVLGSVALYRLINTLAEAIGALLAWSYDQKRALAVSQTPSDREQ